MRVNTYKSSQYQSRRHASQSRRQGGSRLTEKQSLARRITEQFLTQLVICAMVIGVMRGAQMLALKNIDHHIAKVKSAITYSPSLNEIKGSIVEKVSLKDQGNEQAKIPEIIIEEIR